MRAIESSPMVRYVREHIPLEQGLRLESSPNLIIFKVSVREHIPLEQGLRLQGLSR